MSGAKLKKAQYYVWYLGWKECRGLAGREFTEGIVQELLQKMSEEDLPKLTIEVSKKELKVLQLVEKKKGKIDKVKYPSIPARNITYAVQALPPYDDVVACIYLGYNDKTQCSLHVHVYRCDSPDTAAIFVNQLDMIIQIPEHQMKHRKIEEDLARKGEIVLRPPTRLEGYLHHNLPAATPQQGYQQQQFQNGGNNGWRSNDRGTNFTVGSTSHSSGSDPQSPRVIAEEEEFANHSSPRTSSNGYPKESSNVYGDDAVDPEMQQGFDSLAAELKSKLGKQPLLLPPKDYDTVHRKRGNAFDITNRKCMNKEIVGNLGTYDSATVDSVANTTNYSVNQNENTKNQMKNNRNSGENVDISGAFSPRSQKGLRRIPTDEQNILDDSNVSPARPLSPGPLTQELVKNSYFPENGPDLPNYLRQKPPSLHSRQSSGDQSDHRWQGSYHHSRQSSGEISAEPKRPGSYHSRQSSLEQQQPADYRRQGNYHSRQSSGDLNANHRKQGSYHSRQSSGDLSVEENDRRYGAGKYSASNLGIAPKRPLVKQSSSPDFNQKSSGAGFLRRSQDEVARMSVDRHSSGSGTFSSQSGDFMDLGASMPAMKVGQFRRQSSKEANEKGRVYTDEDDPGSFVPIDYTVAARKTKERKAIL